MLDPQTVKPGEVIFRWWDAGISMDAQELKVIRVNRLTYTVETRGGNRFRLPHADAVGKVDWHE